MSNDKVGRFLRHSVVINHKNNRKLFSIINEVLKFDFQLITSRRKTSELKRWQSEIISFTHDYLHHKNETQNAR